MEVSFLNGKYKFTGEHAEAMQHYDPERQPAPAPQWVYDLAARLRGQRKSVSSAPGELIPEGRRNATLTSMAGSMRFKGFDEDAILAALEATNRNRCDPALDAAEVESIARSVSRYEADPLAGVVLKLNGKAEAPASEIVRVPASQLRKLAGDAKWLWQGIIPAEAVTIFSALPKAGKTTLLSHLLRALERESTFCNQRVRAARVVYVTEESETLWADRRDKLGLKDHCEFVLRPFRAKPSLAQWHEFIAKLAASIQERPAELVVIDTLAKLWPVQNENDASEVTAALMPLAEIAYTLGCTLVLVHHLRKSDGLEATATRGSGGITAAVDCILELRRYKAGDRADTRRVLHCDSRFDDRLDEIVVSLETDGYKAQGDKAETACQDCQDVIFGVLAVDESGRQAPGMNTAQIVALGWEDTPAPRKQTVADALRAGVSAGLWRREGTGAKGSPYTYWRPQNDSVSVPPL